MYIIRYSAVMQHARLWPGLGTVYRREMGDSKKETGDSKKEMGDSKRVMGDSKKEMGVSKKEMGVSKRVMGVSKRVMGDSKRVMGDSKRVMGDSKSELKVSSDSSREIVYLPISLQYHVLYNVCLVLSLANSLCRATRSLRLHECQ